MDRPFAAYTGDKPYVFVSYAHKDSAAVFPEISKLRDQGFNIWYDEGIDGGTEWSEALAGAIKRSKLFLFFVSPNSVQSQNCRNEINFAVERGLPVLTVYLKETDLTDGLSLTLSARQAILKYEMPRSEYWEKLVSRIASYLEQQPIQLTPSPKRIPLIAAGIVALSVFLIYNASFLSENKQVSEEATQKVEGTSIAVLPFVNMSSDPEQEYFSDGISEEILNVLARIPNLQVTSRSSAFFYKGKDINIHEVAKVLGVKNVLEGSVRKSGTRVRITAQLINADTDKQLWSESYDRELDDIFKVQDEISSAIVKSLKETLGITLVKANYAAQTINPEAYDYYLQGLRGINVSTFDSLTEAGTAFKSAIKIAPDFLPAKIKLAETFSLQIDIGSRSDRSILDTADEIINQVLVTNPGSAEAYYVRAWIAGRRYELTLAKQYAKEAYRLNPNDADIVVTHAKFNAADIGEEKARTLFNRAQQMDPFDGEIPHHYGMYLVDTLQAYTDAEKAFKQAVKVNPNIGVYPFSLGMLYSRNMANLVDAIEQIELGSKLDVSDPDYHRYLSMLYLSLGDAQLAIEYADKSIALNAHSADAIDARTNVLVYMGQTDKALEFINDSLDNPDTVYRRVSKSRLTGRAVYLLLKENKLAEAESLVNQYFPEVRNLIDSPLPKSADEIVNVGGVVLLSTIYQAQGKTDKAQKLAARLSLLDEDYFSERQARLQSFQYISLARISVIQNHSDKAVTYLEAVVDNGYLLDWRADISQSPEFLSLQQHPRYIALIKRLEAEMVRQRAILEKDLTVE